MIARRGFFARLAGLLGFSAFSAQAETENFRANEARRMEFRSNLIAANLDRFEEFSEPTLIAFLPGKLKISKPRPNRDGTWTTFLEFRSDSSIGPTG